MLDKTQEKNYYKHKLVRFTGVPLNSGVWRLTKTNSGLKQTNVPLRVGAHQRKRSGVVPLLFLGGILSWNCIEYSD